MPPTTVSARIAIVTVTPVAVKRDARVSWFSLIGDRGFESGLLQRQVRRTPTRIGEVPSDLEVVRHWDLAATERTKLNDRTRRSAPSSAATRTMANTGAGGTSEAPNTQADKDHQLLRSVAYRRGPEDGSRRFFLRGVMVEKPEGSA